MQHKFVMGKIQGDPLNQLQQADGSKIQSDCKKKKERLNLCVRIKKMNQNAALSHTILKMEDMQFNKSNKSPATTKPATKMVE